MVSPDQLVPHMACARDAACDTRGRCFCTVFARYEPVMTTQRTLRKEMHGLISTNIDSHTTTFEGCQPDMGRWWCACSVAILVSLEGHFIVPCVHYDPWARGRASRQPNMLGEPLHAAPHHGSGLTWGCTMAWCILAIEWRRTNVVMLSEMPSYMNGTS